MGIWPSFFVALAVSLALTPSMVWIARKKGWVVTPREDRWHKKPTAIFGGVAIFIAFCISFLASSPHSLSHWGLFGCAAGMFVVGLVDDILEVKPHIKLLAQLILALVAVGFGVRLETGVIPWPWLSIPICVFWMVVITNAVNILDNMDGLSSGMVVIACLTLAAGAYLNNSKDVAYLALMIAGAAAGFFVFNFKPAKIFMGDCGSLFLGFYLSGLAILSTNTAAGASHLILSLLLPLGALVLPIFDVSLVSMQRSAHGRSVAQGGRDHSSHRLVFLGLSERKAVLLLLAISAIGGLGSILLMRLASPLAALVCMVLFVIPLIVFGIYLSEVSVYQGGNIAGRLKLLIQHITYKKQILQLLMDVMLLSAAYVGSWLLRYDGVLTEDNLFLLEQSLPWVLGSKIVCFWFFGLYKGEWRYVSIYDLIQILKASLAGTALSVVMLVLLFRFADYPRALILIDLTLSIVLVGGVRSLFRVYREKVRVVKGQKVLILGAGDGGELLLRELKNNPILGFRPVGFLDDDPAKSGKVINGVPVLGTSSDLAKLVDEHQIERLFISIFSAKGQSFQKVYDECDRLGINCTRAQPMVKF